MFLQCLFVEAVPCFAVVPSSQRRIVLSPGSRDVLDWRGEARQVLLLRLLHLTSFLWPSRFRHLSPCLSKQTGVNLHPAHTCGTAWFAPASQRLPFDQEQFTCAVVC